MDLYPKTKVTKTQAKVRSAQGNGYTDFPFSGHVTFRHDKRNFIRPSRGSARCCMKRQPFAVRDR
jgi:hypothetical protein